MELKLNNSTKRLLVALTGFIFFTISIPCFAYENNEFKISLKRKVWKDLSLSGEIDFRHDGSQFFRRHFDFGLGLPLIFLGKGWTFEAHFRPVYTKSKNGNWKIEKRPYGQIIKTFRTPAMKWFPELKWALRTRQEYRVREGDDSTRNRSRIKIKLGKETLKVKPFFSNEFFYDFSIGKYNKNRAIFGIELPEVKKVKSSLYYKLVTDIEEGPNNLTSSLVLKLAF